MGTCYSKTLTGDELDIIESALERYSDYCKQDSEYEEYLPLIENLEKKIRFHSSIDLPKKEQAFVSLQEIRIAKVQMVGGDAQTIQERINKMLPEWQMDGVLILKGDIFWQKMVQKNAL